MKNMNSIIEAIKTEGIKFQQINESTIKIASYELKFSDNIGGQYYVDFYKKGNYCGSAMQTVDSVFEYLDNYGLI